MAYFMLYTREEDGLWSPQFGDFRKSDVEQERRDTYQRQRGHGYEGDGKYAAKDIRIIRFDTAPDAERALIAGALIAEGRL